MANEDHLDLFNGLADKVIEGVLTIEEAVMEIKSPPFSAKIDLRSINANEAQIRSICFTSLPRAYFLSMLGREAARELGDKRCEVHCLGTLANVCNLLSKSEDALKIADEQAAMAQKINDEVSIATSLLTKGDSHFTKGTFQRSVELYQQASQIFRSNQCLLEQSWIFGRLGETFYMLGQHRRSLDFFQRAIVIAREQDDRSNESRWLVGLGLTQLALGERRWSEDYCQEALAITDDIQDFYIMSFCLDSLGLIKMALGETEEALNYFQKATKLCDEIGYQRGSARCKGHIGVAHLVLGDHWQAKSLFQEALHISRELSDKHGEGIWLGELASVWYELSNAAKLQSQGYDKQSDINSQLTVHITPDDQQSQYYYEQALQSYKEAYQISLTIDDLQSQCNWLNKLGDLYSVQQQFDSAKNYYQTALQVARRVGYKTMVSLLWGKLGESYRQVGNHYRALDYALQGLRSVREIEDINGECQILQTLGAIYEDRGELNQGLDYYEQALELRELLRSSWKILERRIAYLGRYIDLYVKVILLLASVQDLKQAFTLVERSRTRAFIEQLADTLHPQTKIDEKELTSLLVQTDNIGEQLHQLQVSLEKAPEHLKLELSQEFTRKQTEMNNALDQIERLTSSSDVYKKVREYVDLKRGSPLDFMEARWLLNE